jgi:hypothetical protein
MCTQQTYLWKRDILIQPQIVQLINLLQARLVFGQHLGGCTRESVTTEDTRCGVGIWRNDAGGDGKRVCSPVATRVALADELRRGFLLLESGILYDPASPLVQLQRWLQGLPQAALL